MYPSIRLYVFFLGQPASHTNDRLLHFSAHSNIVFFSFLIMLEMEKTFKFKVSKQASTPLGAVCKCVSGFNWWRGSAALFFGCFTRLEAVRRYFRLFEQFFSLIYASSLTCGCGFWTSSLVLFLSWRANNNHQRYFRLMVVSGKNYQMGDYIIVQSSSSLIQIIQSRLGNFARNEMRVR